MRKRSSKVDSGIIGSLNTSHHKEGIFKGKVLKQNPQQKKPSRFDEMREKMQAKNEGQKVNYIGALPVSKIRVETKAKLYKVQEQKEEDVCSPIVKLEKSSENEDFGMLFPHKGKKEKFKLKKNIMVDDHNSSKEEKKEE